MATITGTVASTSPIATQSVTASAGKSATVAQTLSPVAQAASGTFLKTYSATVSQSLSPVVQAGTATFGPDTSTATISQTLPALSQTATGLADFFSATSSLSVSEVVGAEFTNSETTPVYAVDLVQYEEVRAVTDSLDVSESYEYTAGPEVSDSLQLTDATGVVWTTAIAEDTFYVRERVTHSVTVVVTESLSVGDSAVPSSITAVNDALALSDLVEASGTFSEAVVESLQVSDSVSIGKYEAVSDSLSVSETAVDTIQSYQEASDSLNATDASVNTVSTFEELSDELRITDAASMLGSVSNQVVSDVVTIRDIAWAKDFAARAWVLNTETGGLSTYDNFGFNSLAEVDGVLYATSPEGVFALTGDNDEGRWVSAEVQTGFLDFGTEQTKRLSDLFVGYTGGQLECDVETYDGPQEVYTYTMEERDADAPRNNRLKIGRGLSSRYWRFAIRNLDGADFQVYDVTAEVGTSRRRL